MEFGFAGDVISTVQDGIAQGLSREEIAANVAAGLLTSLTTNFSCMLTKFYPPVGYILMGVAALVVGLVAVVNISNGNTEFGIAQVINLVSIVFHMFNPTCFTGDTEVYTSEGLVCIEEIEVGDEVWAYNSETGETELKEVLNVWVKETDEILHVSTSDGETIDTTTNHPFYVGEKGWVAAGDLEVGDTLVTADGDEVEVTELELEKLAEPITVYNLEVEDFHTYFVGEYGVLVHNYLTDVQKSRLDTLDNTINDHLTDMDFSGLYRDLLNDPVPKPGGGYYDHIDEVSKAYKSLKKIAKSFANSLKNPNLLSDDRQILENALGRTNSYIDKIIEIFEMFGRGPNG